MHNLPHTVVRNVQSITTHRANLIKRIGRRIFVAVYQRPSLELAQPSMAWFDGPRTQPRDGRGRFLSKAWLADAELFTATDRAWFRHPVTSEER